MRPDHRARVPALVALVCAVSGLLVIAGTTWFAGGQHTLFTQFQFVVIAFGAGVGPLVVAGVLYTASRRHTGERRVEEALARMLRAAATLPAPDVTAGTNGARWSHSAADARSRNATG